MFRFGAALVDTAARVVEVDGEPRHLEPQAFDVLAYLLHHRDRVVSKEELFDAVWGDQFVSESALTTRVKEIRQVLGDDGRRQEWVRNYRGRGYRFVAEIADDAPRDTATPDPPMDLLGRDGDLAAVAQHLRSHRVVTLVGPGGVGKTTLARAAAGHARRAYPGGVHVVPLAPVREPADVTHVLRRATGLTEPGIDDAGLVAAIAELDALVVVDNCEHVLAESARLVEAIADTPGTTRVLATSRERLGIRYEQVHRLAPLADGAARDLLRARVRAIHPGYEWRPDEEADVDRLLQMLDHLPLAIEMAAARFGSVGAHELVTHLADRLDLLRAPSPTAADRHRTVPALVAWSEELLDREPRALLTELSVFAGPVTAGDIATVVGLDEADLALGLLTDLVDHSLLVADTARQPTRYRLLATVRASVAPRRDPSTDERHARHVTDVVRAADRTLRTPDEAEGARRIEGLIEEIRVAHRWARHHDLQLASTLTSALLYYAFERQWSEPADWSRDALAAIERGEVTVDASPFAAAIAADASNRDDLVEATTMAELALAGADEAAMVSAYDTLGNIGMYDGDLDASRRHGTALIDLGERTSDAAHWMLGVVQVVLAALYSGLTDEARRLLDDHVPPVPLSPTSEAWRAYAEGEVLAVEGHVDASVERFDRAISSGSSVGSRFVTSMARTSLLTVQARAGDIDAALGEFAAVLAHHRRTRSLTHGITALRNLIVLLVRAGRDEFAMTLLGTLSDPNLKSTYGSESDLLDETRADVEARHDRDLVSSWLAAGATRDLLWALDHAIATLGSAPA